MLILFNITDFEFFSSSNNIKISKTLKKGFLAIERINSFLINFVNSLFKMIFFSIILSIIFFLKVKIISLSNPIFFITG